MARGSRNGGHGDVPSRPGRRGFLRRVALLPALAGLQAVTGRGARAAETRTMGQGQEPAGPRVGVALGAGGAAGLAHIAMLEVLDELGVRPHHVTGASIGAVIGALYASGMPARRIRELAAGLVVSERDTWRDVLLEKSVFRWAALLDPEVGRGGLISGEAFLADLYGQLDARDFEDLPIPLSVVATDFWERAPVVFDQGPFRVAVEASMALPGLFAPVRLDGRVLIDGGAVDPVPWDLLPGDCDLTVAIDVTGRRPRSEELSALEVVFNTFEIMQSSIVAARHEHGPPDVYVAPDIVDIRALEFHRLDEVLAQAAPARDALRQRLGTLLGAS
ncbi:MAG: patatin-like phospholipase family protein [Halofilum sp. (in: g-proteobacteria)]|nr:patatin-like phospholipase family protein [Halofilum sp. (in: g-proteobacteria)]